MKTSKFIALLVGIGILMIVNLLLGSVKIPVDAVCQILLGDESNEIWTNIIWKSRLPQVLTAIVAGAGLAVMSQEGNFCCKYFISDGSGRGTISFMLSAEDGV